jgi:WD40 repeat protein
MKSSEIRTIRTSGLAEPIFGPSGIRLATLTKDNGKLKVNLLDGFGKPVATIDTQQDDPYIVFSPDGRRLATRGPDDTVALWRSSGELLDTIHLKSSKSRPEIVFGPDGPWFATIEKDSKIALWDTKGNLLVKLDTKAGGAKVIVGKDGQRLATISGIKRNIIDVWDLKGNRIAETSLHDYVYQSTFSPSDQRMAAGFQDGTVQMWNLDRGTIMTIYTGQGIIDDLKFSPNGRWLATCSQLTGSVNLWDRDGNLIATLNTHQNSVYRVMFIANGQILATSGPGMVKLWQIGGEKELVRRICYEWRDYLHNASAALGESDRHLCDGIRGENKP